MLFKRKSVSQMLNRRVVLGIGSYVKQEEQVSSRRREGGRGEKKVGVEGEGEHV